MESRKTIFTIGHGNLDVEDFIKLLADKKINLIIDIRKNPGSYAFPQYNKSTLKGSLTKHKIKYIYLGDILGGDTNFQRYKDSSEYKQGIYELKRYAENNNAAILCSELDHTTCHRRFIASTLTEKGYDVQHIQRNGSLVAQERSLITLRDRRIQL